MRRVVVLGLLLGLMALLQILQVGSDTAFNPFSLATFGFVLLAAYTLGQVAANLQLPKITGYIVTGLVFGPQILNVFSSAVEADLRVVNDLAIGLIALSAGAEMHLAGLRKIARSLLLIVLIKGGLILVAITGLVIALANFIPFLAGQPIGLVASVGMILGVMAIGTSPAATIAVINETGAKGRLADTTLGVAVAKDIVMVILLALGIALARTFSAEGHGFEVAILGELALELFLSLLAGAALGGVIIAYLKYVRAEPWLFTVGVIFAMTAIAHQFHLEALLVFIVAGFVVQNASSLGHDFVELAERVALPVYVVFFSVAGAGLDLGALRAVLLIALAIAVVRAAAIYAGTAVATRLAGEPEEVRKNAWLSFVAQAGVVIGLSIIVENNLGALGTEIRTLVMGTVAIHLLIGPILFKIALTRAGEVAGAEPDEEPEIVDEEEPAFFVLPPTLEEPVVALEARVYEALQSLAETASRGPLETARTVRGWPGDGRAEKEHRIESGWAREFQIAVERFWSEVHRTSLEAPRQISLELESRWFTDARWDTASQRWTKRLRRARRILRRLSGASPALHRIAPLRTMALYHIDHALASDLHPVLVEIGAQPARTLQKGLGLGGQSDGDGVLSAQEVLNGTVAQEVLRPVVERRFRILRRELDRVGTADLPPSRRRASGLHERAVRARGRTAEAIEAWEEFANGVVQHEHRREAVDQLRKELGDQASRLELDVGSHLDATVLQPLKRAEDVLRRALTSLESLEGDDADAVEQGLLEVGEEITTELRRQALAGLRRRLEVEPVRKILQEFDDAVEVKLDGLPESFVVVAPDALPTKDQAVRAYPEPATHAFRLIATGAVERTLRPSLAELGERSQALLAQASDSVQALRESLELRFDAAADAAIEAGRLAARTPDLPVSVREPLEIARSALTSALQDLDALRDRLDGHADEALTSFREDFKALSDRLELQLASARPLEARLQAERARVELEGTAVLRLLLDRGRHIVKLGIQRLGLRLPARTSARPGQDERRAPLKPGGREGSDRAVLFHILFDETTVAGKVFDGGLILAILASIVVLMLESVESYRMDHGATLAILEWLFTLLFTLEYATRLWAVDRPARYAFSFFGIIDLLAVLPTYLSLIVPGGQYLMGIRMLRVVRAFRVLKLARYVGEAEVLMNALRASRYKITVFLVSVLCVAVVMGSSMYLIEGPSSGFTSIPRGVYWSIVTLTTVGFGDITPQSPLGQTLAAILMVLGYGIIAVPTGIVTAELATASPPSRTVQACRQCGHREQDPAAAFCLVCGDRLTVA